MKKRSKKILLYSIVGTSVAGVALGASLPFAFNHQTKQTQISQIAKQDNSTTSVGQSLGNNVFAKTVDNGRNQMKLTLHAKHNTILAQSVNNTNALSAVISDDSSVALSTSLIEGTNNPLGISDISYQWYYTSTAPSASSVMSSSDGTLIEGETQQTLNVTTTNFANTSSHVLYFFVIISFKISANSNDTFTAPSGVFAISDNGINVSQTINNETAKPTGLLTSQTATLGLSIENNTNNDFSNISYKWGSSTTNDSSNIDWTTSNLAKTPQNYSVSSLNGLNYYFGEITYSYEGYSFSYITSAFVLDGVNANIKINDTNLTYTNLADYDNDEATLSLDMGVNTITVSNVQWYKTTSESASVNVTTTTPTASGDTYLLTNTQVPADTLGYYSAYVTYNLSTVQETFTVMLNSVLIINVQTGTISGQTKNDSSATPASNITPPTFTPTQTITSGSTKLGTNGANLASNESANLNLSFTNTKNISNITYTWYSTTSSTFSINSATKLQTTTTSSLPITVKDLKNTVNYYFMVMNYDYEGQAFQYISSAFVVTNISANINYTKEYNQSRWTKGLFDRMLFTLDVTTTLPSTITDVTYSHNTIDAVTNGVGPTDNGTSFYIDGVWGETYSPVFTISFKVGNVSISFQVTSSFYA